MTILLGKSGFNGEVPKLSPHKLPYGYAAIARNVKAYSGDLEPFREPRTIDKSEKPDDVESFYLMASDPTATKQGGISSVLNTNPVTIVCDALHGLQSGKYVYIDDTGIGAIDGKKYAITVEDSTSFTLNGTSASGASTTGVWNRRFGYWLTWTGGADVDAVKAPYKNDNSARTAYSGESTPRVTNSSLVSTGTFQYPEAWYILGVPAPLTEPTVTVVGTPPADPSQYDNRTYVYTFLSAWGEESAPSPASVVAPVGPDQTANLSSMELAPAGQYNITHRRVYRWVTDAGQFRLVVELPVGQTTLGDNLKTASLPQVSLVSADWDTPPANLTGLVVLPNGFMAGYYLKDIYFCEPYQPHAWPLNYRRTVNDTVTGLAAYKSTIVVGTQGHPVLLVGSHPGGMVDEVVHNFQACVSKASMTAIGDIGAAYASPDGLIMVGVGKWKNLTDQYFDRDEWQLFNPSSMRCAVHNSKMFVFYRSDASSIDLRGRTYPASGGFWFDPLNPNGVFFIDDDPKDIHVDVLTDSLYLLMDDGRIKRLDGGSTHRAYQYRSKKHLLQRPVNYTAARVDADSFDDTKLRLFTNNGMKTNKAVPGQAAFRVGGNSLDRSMQVEVRGTDQVTLVAIGESPSSLASG